MPEPFDLQTLLSLSVPLFMAAPFLFAFSQPYYRGPDA